MADRRRDDRVQIGLECLLYVEGLDEIEAVVKDISEIGIAFEIPFSNELDKLLESKKEMQFAYLDDFIFLDSHIEIILQAACKVVRVSKDGEKLIVGCELKADEDIRHYVTQRKVKKFIDNIRGLKY